MKKLILFSLVSWSFIMGQAQNNAPASFLTLRQVPDASYYLPAPPDTSSIAYLNDFHRYQWGRSQRATKRGRQADFDTFWQVDSILKGFTPAFGLKITRENTPETYALMCKVCVDAELGVSGAKKHYLRTRPYVQYHEHTGYPQQEEELKHTGSYPSGHSARGWATALVLSELRPERQDQILNRGYQYGESRVIEGYHYQSDVDAARLAASAVVARLHADRTFLGQIARAKKELANILPGVPNLDLGEARLVDVASLQGDSLQAYQGMSIYKDYLVSLQNKGLAAIYQLPGMKKLTATFRLGCYSDKNHANVASFGVEKFDKHDVFPLLYVSQAYKTPVKGLKDICYVERLNLEGSSELVQRIIFDDPDHLFGYALQWTIDRKNQLLIGFGNTLSNNNPDNRFRVIIFHLPKINEGKDVHLRATEAVDNYLFQDSDSRYPAEVVGQGACVYDNCLVMPTGLGSKQAPSILYVWDLKNKSLLDVIDLSGKLDHEMEDVDFYGGNAYIQTNGRGIVMLKIDK